MDEIEINNEKGLQLLNSFYYLAPAWFILETFFWPNFRAGIISGGGHLGTAAFYTVESGIGVALWLKMPYAAFGALLENVVYLIFIIKYIVLSPVDAALALAADNAVTTEFAKNYVAAIPGTIFSLLQVVMRIKLQIRGMSVR